jgi:A/G-specific adenine glycosylase
MPWKGEKDPYKIWLSEVILQQTRVEQGLKYYEAFVKNFPTVHHLAKAPEQKVFKLWEGLGYYSRCKNLIASARFIVVDLNGVFPKDYESILGLKGVGGYTAAAIASFAYDLPYAVLDGNVFRVLSRIFDIETAIDSKEGKLLFNAVAQYTLSKKSPGVYNQAIMDFGAVICKPVPVCSDCFFNKNCQAFLQGKQQALPVKEKAVKVRERWFNYAVLKVGDEYAIRERTGKDIWQHLYEFVLVETDRNISIDELKVSLKDQYNLAPNKYSISLKKAGSSQKLSHQKINYSYTILEVKEKITVEGFVYVKGKTLKKYPFPRALKQFIAEELDSL